MIKRDPPGLGQNQAAPASFKEIMAQSSLKRLDLGGKGRLRQVQPPCSASQRAIGGDRAEQTEVMQVQDIHLFHQTEQYDLKYVFFWKLRKRYLNGHISRIGACRMTLLPSLTRCDFR
jgi:hypothetical protein